MGLAQAWGAWVSAWENLRIEVDEYRELDNDRVLVLARKTGRGKQYWRSTRCMRREQRSATSAAAR